MIMEIKNVLKIVIVMIVITNIMMKKLLHVLKIAKKLPKNI